MLLLFLLLILTYNNNVKSFTAYDCTGINMNVTRVSLIDTHECRLPITKQNSESTYIQLLQYPEHAYTSTFSCKISVIRNVYYCGMSSHISIVHNGFASYIKEVGEQTCRSIIKFKSYDVSSTSKIDNLRINTTISVPIMLSGKATSSASCTGENYSDYFGTWENVMVQSIFTITIQESRATLQHKDNSIILSTGTRCTYNTGYCYDSENGDTYWDIIPLADCTRTSLSVIHQGSATKYFSIDNTSQNITGLTYFVEDDNTMYALRTLKQINICGQNVYTTEHPKLLIIENNKEDFYYRKVDIPIENYDLFTYINTKFVFVEKHIKRQMSDMYNDIMLQKCQIESQVIQNLLTLAFVSPNDFAYMYMHGPGYTAHVLGEAINIIKCQPVEVNLNQLDRCYDELPVLYNNKTMFMKPRSHILLDHGNEVSCNEILSSAYKLLGNWYQFSPIRHHIPTPEVFGITKPGKWEYIDIKHLASNGIYSPNELENLRNHIMFPLEKTAVENIMVRNYLGLNPDMSSQKASYLLTPYDVEKLKDSIMNKFWSFVTNFGNFSSGLIGIYMIYNLIKNIINLGFNGLSLYKTLGCGLHLFAIIFSSLTNFLITQSNKNSDIDNDITNKDKENQEVIIPLTSEPIVNHNQCFNQRSIYPDPHI